MTICIPNFGFWKRSVRTEVQNYCWYSRFILIYFPMHSGAGLINQNGQNRRITQGNFRAHIALTSHSCHAHITFKSCSHCAHFALNPRSLCAHVVLKWGKTALKCGKLCSWCAMSAMWHCFLSKIQNFWAQRERSTSATSPQMSTLRVHYERTKSAMWAHHERLKMSLKWGTNELNTNFINVHNNKKCSLNIVTVKKLNLFKNE